MTEQQTFKAKYGPWALVTGGTSGIGEALVKQLAVQGINIVLVARRQALLEQKATEIRNEYGVRVKTISADLSDPAAVETLKAATKDLEIGMFIPNAAVETSGAFLKGTVPKEIGLLQINVNSPMQLAHHFGSLMAKRGRGGILFVSSLAGYGSNPYLANYAASKAYILSFGESLHYELKKKGVDVTVLSPGLTETPMATGAAIDWAKMPMSIMDADATATVGLKALGRKPSVIPGARNNVMAFMGKHVMTRKAGVNMFGSMMENALSPELL